MKNVFKLIDVVCTVYDKYADLDNKHGTTYCNFAAEDIADAFGIHDFRGKMANDIVDFLAQSSDWSEVKLAEAQDMANVGTLIFAVQKEEGHGHICVVRPGVIKSSGKMGQVPSVMNIGKDNFISKGLSWAFQEPPTLYAWKPTL